MIGRAGAVLAGIVGGAGCTCSHGDPAPPPAPSAARAAGGRPVNLAESRRVQARLAAGSASAAPGTPPATDGRERAKGHQLHAELTVPCGGDDACLLDRCGRACAEWIRGAYAPGELAPPRLGVQVQVNCTGACIGGPDAGAPASGPGAN